MSLVRMLHFQELLFGSWVFSSEITEQYLPTENPVYENMESFLENLTKHVQCSLCNDTLIEPKILPCFHTFCKLCIKRHAELIEEVNVFKCPKCKTETSLPELGHSVEDLKPSLLHSRFLKVLTLVDSERVCSVCKNLEEASWYCLDRNRLLCKNCANTNSFINKDQEMISLNPLSKFDLERILRSENLCQDHEQIFGFYCKDCKECICIYCFRSRECRVHSTIPLDGSSLEKHLTKEILDQLKAKEDGMMKKLEKLKETTATIKEDGEKAKRELNETVEQLIERLRKQQEEIVKEIEQRSEEVEQTLKKRQEEIERIRQAMTLVDEMKEFGVVSEITKAIKDNEHCFKTTFHDQRANIDDSRFKFVLSNESRRLMHSKHGLGSLQRAEMTMAIHFDSEPEALKKTKLTLIDMKKEEDKESTSNAAAAKVEISRKDDEKKVEKYKSNHVKAEIKFSLANQSPMPAKISELEASKQTSQISKTRISAENNTDPYDAIDVKLFAEDHGANLEVKKVRTDGKIEVEFMPKVPGPLTAEVQVNGNHVSNSPLVMNVKPQQMKITDFNVTNQTLEKSQDRLASVAVNKGTTRLAASNWSSNSVHVFDHSVNPLLTYGSQGSEEGQLCTPHGLVFLNDSDLVIADCDNHRICIINTTTGKLVKAFGNQGNGDGEFNEPYGVHVDDDGNIIVCDHFNHRLQVFTRDGDYQYQFGLTKQDNFHPIGTVTHGGRYYVSDYSNHVIHVFEKKDGVPTRISTIGSKGSGDGQLNTPCGLAIDNDHHLLVCDHGNNRIQKFTLDGRFIGKSHEIEKPYEIAVWKGGFSLISTVKSKLFFVN